jgi:hypothetical protein
MQLLGGLAFARNRRICNDIVAAEMLHDLNNLSRVDIAQPYGDVSHRSIAICNGVSHRGLNNRRIAFLREYITIPV